MRQQRKSSGLANAGAGNSGLDLGQLFSAALGTVDAQRQQINALDGRNGNHGDNMVHNLQVITQALQSQAGQAPTEQLQYAAGQLQANGRGSTGQHYARGLNQAAQQFQGQAALKQNDIGTLLGSLMNNVPVQSAAPRPPASPAAGGDLSALLGQLGGAAPDAGGDPLSALLGAVGGQASPPAATPGDPLSALLGAALGGGQPPAPAGGNVLTTLLGLATGAAPQTPAAAGAQPGLDLGDLLSAGMAFMQAKQQGADTGQAALQAVMSALAGGQVNPLQSGSPHAAAGGLLAQGLLQAALGRQ